MQKIWKRMYLDRNSASKSIEILKQLANSDLIPRVPILFSKYKISREIIKNWSPAVWGFFCKQLTLWRSMNRGIKKCFKNFGPCFPKSISDRRMIHSRPQTKGFSIGISIFVKWWSQSGENWNGIWRRRVRFHGKTVNSPR